MGLKGGLPVVVIIKIDLQHFHARKKKIACTCSIRPQHRNEVISEILYFLLRAWYLIQLHGLIAPKKAAKTDRRYRVEKIMRHAATRAAVIIESEGRASGRAAR